MYYSTTSTVACRYMHESVQREPAKTVKYVQHESSSLHEAHSLTLLDGDVLLHCRLNSHGLKDAQADTADTADTAGAEVETN